MEHHNLAVGFVLTVLSMLVFAELAVAGEQVPLRGRLQGDVTFTGTPPIVQVDIGAAGGATQLGSFTVSIPHVVEGSTPPLPSRRHISFTPADRGGPS